MAEPVFSVEVEDKDLMNALQELKRRAGDVSPALEEIGEYGIAVTDRRFRNEVDVNGIPFVPLSRRTVNEKRARGQILKILQRTGLMRSRVNYQIVDQTLFVGVNDKKARKHQFGIGVPKREFLGFNEDDIRESTEIVRSYILDE